jgi:putative membrane protein
VTGTGTPWRRLHPLSPIVRGGRGTIGIAIVLLPTILRGDRTPTEVFVQIGVVGALVLLGVVSWIVTRWKIEDDDVLIETGLIRRRSLRFPLSQLQSVDIVRPGLARVFRVAELRLRMGGSTGDTGRLAYLRDVEVEPLRAQLLALARGAAAAPAGTAPLEPVAGSEHVLTVVPTGRLIASILISDVGLFAEAVTVALVVTAVLSPGAAEGIVRGGLVWIIGIATLVWRRFNQEYRLTVSEGADGLHVRSGLIALTAETIRPGRVQAVRMLEPLLWRRFGWCRLEVDVAGHQRSKGEGQAQRGRLRTMLPVGSRALVDELLEQLVPERPVSQSPPPRRARWKSPLRYRMLRAGRNDDCVVTVSGRIRRVTCWVPLEKAQSFREVQGPVQRRLGLATVHVDTVGRGVRAALRDRDVGEAEQVLAELPGLARSARRRYAAGTAAGAAAAPAVASRPGS